MSRILARGLGRLCAFLASNTGLLSFGFLHGQPPVSRGSPSAPFPVELSGSTSSMLRHPLCPLYEVHSCTGCYPPSPL